MQNLFKPGDTKVFTRTVRPEDCASFSGQEIHPLYSTFALARDAEWCCRQFVLDMKEDDEEGIGTFIEIRHESAAPVGSVIQFIATTESIQGHDIICQFTASVNGKIVARGRQGQKILKRSRLATLYLSGQR